MHAKRKNNEILIVKNSTTNVDNNSSAIASKPNNININNDQYKNNIINKPMVANSNINNNIIYSTMDSTHNNSDDTNKINSHINNHNCKLINALKQPPITNIHKYDSSNSINTYNNPTNAEHIINKPSRNNHPINVNSISIPAKQSNPKHSDINFNVNADDNIIDKPPTNDSNTTTGSKRTFDPYSNINTTTVIPML